MLTFAQCTHYIGFHLSVGSSVRLQQELESRASENCTEYPATVSHKHWHDAYSACLLLQPYQDTHAGTVETWPAHASARGSNGPSLHLSSNKHPVVTDNSVANGSANMQLTPKPKFLEQLEVFLQKELHCLGVTTVEPSDVRLQVSNSNLWFAVSKFTPEALNVSVDAC